MGDPNMERLAAVGLLTCIVAAGVIVAILMGHLDDYLERRRSHHD